MLSDPRPHPELIRPSAFLAPGVVVVGDVTIGPKASLWFGVIVRGDTEKVVIGAQTNVQDGCLLHADPGQPCLLGERVSLGHGAIVHAAMVEDGARIGAGSLVAAGAVVTPGTVIPPGSVVMGTPGRVARNVTEADRERIRLTAEHYRAQARAYREACPRPGGA